MHDRDIKDMSKIVTKQKDLNFGRRKTLRKYTITFNFRIIDGHVEFPYFMLLIDKSNKRSAKLETAVTWSKSNLNMMNIYEESTVNFWIWNIKLILLGLPWSMYRWTFNFWKMDLNVHKYIKLSSYKYDFISKLHLCNISN